MGSHKNDKKVDMKFPMPVLPLPCSPAKYDAGLNFWYSRRLPEGMLPDDFYCDTSIGFCLKCPVPDGTLFKYTYFQRGRTSNFDFDHHLSFLSSFHNISYQRIELHLLEGSAEVADVAKTMVFCAEAPVW